MAVALRRLGSAFLASMTIFTVACSFWSFRGRPEANSVRGYLLDLSQADGSFRTVSIGAQGEGCEVFLPDADANRVCLIATLDNPLTIGGEAYGDLNDRHTLALDALVWRARSMHDVTVCERGGLQAEFLTECDRAARDPEYEYVADGYLVRVPLDGAEPEATRSTGLASQR